MNEKSDNKITLSENQIDQLFEFAEKKRVYWYDLQIDIVKDLALTIETEMETHPNLSFELALEKVYARYGVFGFAKIVQERQEQLRKAAKKKWREEVGKFIEWPKMLFVILVVIITWQSSLFIDRENRLYVFWGIDILLTLFLGFTTIKDRRIFNKLLLLSCGARYLPFSLLFMVSVFSSGLSSVSFTIITSVVIIATIASYYVYRKIRLQAEELYPAVFNKHVSTPAFT
ncbi:MAG: hypothetical protein ACTHJ5_01475 [Ilyomonas sp.]